MSISNSPKVLWLQVWRLAAVQGAIALTWVIYNLYLAKLLTSFGFPKELATVIFINYREYPSCCHGALDGWAF